ncbi:MULTISPECIES: 4Fe-4S dicluster domain-containing protein [unclassified Candidatus Frackibacter]|uniref:4Fe-4S dicluster domain-containing protein n=1 Tax=unclassified Candidatus Frackibacter TaxID=2648818 RepID=UPI0008849567|nr:MULTISPECIES: 4Fe-4S dicluster domain-containing protein [unclassified Candidatus Frackibacter]SDC77613.1 heterodisulfide reductase subunit C [Candidatus Frackibacter sp. WG11]SEM90596.1 heterodisulfide reductase subunit C [Candidatus Frackibacter sp. WG12]SFM00086.1 heterodisulfide reductase subunit C [Candidatus Frackibacter sp. WG13]
MNQTAVAASSLLVEQKVDSNFFQQVKEASGENIGACMQCGTCSGSCPTSYQMDYTPRKIISLIRAGYKDKVLKSKTIWMCASCYACAVRCPRGIKFTDVMYALKTIAIEEGTYNQKDYSPTFYKEFTNVIKKYGRLSERDLITRYSLKTNFMNLFKFAPLGLKLLQRGRLTFVNDKIEHQDELEAMLDKIEEMKGA